MTRYPITNHLNAANAVTSLSLVFAFCGLVFAARGEPVAAFAACALCIPCDTLDGMLARRFGLTSSFGAQLDSLADSLAFCVLPAMLGYALGLSGAWTIFPIWFLLGGVWRLAHFEETGTTEIAGRVCFQGVPTPVMAGFLFPVAAVALVLPRPASLGLLAAYYGLAPLLLNGSWPFPKRGMHIRAMWLIVPLSWLGLYWRLH